jgi:hypothetical protein
MNATQAKTLAILNVQKRSAREEENERKRDAMRASLITDNEIEEIILGVMRTREDQAVTTADMADIINMIIADRFMAVCSELAGKGLVDVAYYPERPVGERIEYKWRNDLTKEEIVTLDKLCERQDQIIKGA